MLSFTNNQWTEVGRLAFARRMIDIIRNRYAAQSSDLTDEALGSAITAQEKLAVKYGLLDEQAAATFVLTAWWLGEGFDERIPVLSQVLRSPELTVNQKVQAMTDFTLATFEALSVDRDKLDRAAGRSS